MASGRAKLVILSMGDSTTAGTPGFRSPVESPPNGEGDERSQFAYWMMDAHEEWLVLNRGVNGERSDQVLARFVRDLPATRPRFVTILAGVNDVYQGYPERLTKENLAKMYDGILEAKSVPVACTILPYNTITPEQDKSRKGISLWISEECRKRSIPFCDTAGAAADPADPGRLRSSPDGLHPDVEGYRRVGLEIVKVIEGCLS